MEKSDELVFEELELQEDLFWQYVGWGAGGLAVGIIVYVALAT